MEPAKDSDEDSLVRIMARLNDKCQRRGQSYKLFKNDCKIPMPRPSIIRPIKPASNMAVSTPVACKYRQNVSCSFDDMSSIVETPTMEKPHSAEKNPAPKTSSVLKTPALKTPSVLKTPVQKTPSVLKTPAQKTNASNGKEMEVSKNMTVITVNSSSSCHVNSTLKTSRIVKPEPPSVQSDLDETNKRPASFNSNRSNRTASVIEISSASMRPEDSNLSKSALKSVSQRKDSTYDVVVNQSNGSSRSEIKEKDATFDIPTRQQLTVTESKRDATFDGIEANSKVSNRKKANAPCRNCLGCSSHHGSLSSLNSKSRERIRSPVKSSKSKSFIDTSDKGETSKESNERNKSITTKIKESTNVTLGRRMSRSMSRLNEVSIGGSVKKRKDNGDTTRGRKNGTDSAAVSKKVEPKSTTVSRRMSRSMSIINDASIGGSVNETKNSEMSKSRKNATISSVGSKKETPKNTTLSRRVSRSMSIINVTGMGGSVNEMKTNRDVSRSRKNETIGTDSVVSIKGTPKNAAYSRRVSRSMSRIDDISIGSSVHDTRSKRNASKTRDNVTTFGDMDATLTIDKPRFQADFTKSKIREPSVEKANKMSRPQRDATLKEISNVMVDDATFEKPRSVSRVANRQHKRKQSPSLSESFGVVAGNQPETKMQKKNHGTRREISVQVTDQSWPVAVNNGITPRKLTALGEIIPKVDALEKIVKYLAEKRPVTPQKRNSIPRRTICTQTGKSMEARTSEKIPDKHSVGVGSDTIDDDDEERDFFSALDIPKIVVSPKLIEYNVDNLPWRLRTPQAKPKRQPTFNQNVQNEQNGTVKNIFDSLVESSDDDENMLRSSPRKYRPSAAVTNRKVFLNKRKTTMNVRRSSQQESLRKALLKKRSRISLKRPSLSSSSDDEIQRNPLVVNVPREKLGNKEQPAKPSKLRLSVVEDFSYTEFSDKENSAIPSSTSNSLAVKTPTINIPQLTSATNKKDDQYISKILSESPVTRNSPFTRRSKTKNGAIKEAVRTPAVPSPVVIRPPSPFEDSFNNAPDDLNQDEVVSTSRTEISHKNATALDREQLHQNPSTSRQTRESEDDCFNEVSTTSELKNKKNSSNSRVAKNAKQKSKDQFDPDDEPTSSRKTSKRKSTNKKAPPKKTAARPRKTREVNEDIREGSPTPSEVSLNLRRSSRQRNPPKRLNEVGFLNCRSDREYDDWLLTQNKNVFKIPHVPKTKRRRTIKKSMAATIAKNKPGRKTTNRTTESSQMTNRTTECSQMTNRPTDCSQMTNRMTECSQMTNRMTECSQMTNRMTECSQMTNRTTGCSQMMFNADMSTVSSTAGDRNKRTNKNDVSYCSSKQNDTLQSVDFSTESDHFRIVSNNLQNLHFKSLKQDDNVSVAWTLASNSGRTTTGYLKLEPGALKPKQISANHELSFLVFKGKAKIGVQDTTHIVSTTESFIVPKGMEYYIINVSKTEELLLMFHRFHLE